MGLLKPPYQQAEIDEVLSFSECFIGKFSKENA